MDFREEFTKEDEKEFLKEYAGENRYKKFAETYTEKSHCTWDASYQKSKLNYWLDNLLMFLEEGYGSKQDRKKWEEEVEQIKEALAGPEWLKEIWAKNKKIMEEN
jgi:hypothetical protein